MISSKAIQLLYYFTLSISSRARLLEGAFKPFKSGISIAAQQKPRQTKKVSWSYRKKMNAAVQALEAGNFTDSDKILSELISPDGEPAEALLHRAYARLRAGDLESALKDAETCVRLRPDGGIFFMMLGEIQLELKKNTEALSSLKKACELEKDNGRAYFHLGRALIANNRRPEAADMFERALQFERDYVMSQWMARSL